MATYLDYLMGLGETGATLGSGAMAGLLGMPYGVYKGATSGKLGTREANRIAEEEARKFMEQYTYQPRGKVAPEMMQTLGGLLESSKLPPVIPEAAMLSSIPRQAVASQAERAGMAAERAVAPMVERTMQKGGLGAGLLGDLSRGSVSPLDVYHGTPHTLPPTARNPLGEFDASKIGTGEGAQAYGYGIYTAENPAVAKEYQKQLGTQMKYKGKEFYDPIVGRKTGTTGNTEIDDYLLSYLGDTGVIRKELLNAAKDMRSSKNPQAAKEYQKLMSEFRKVRPDVTAANTGNLYKIDLPDEKISAMLDWDKPLIEQPKNVQEALAKYDPDMYSPSGNDYSPEERGQWIYMRLAGNTTQKNASNKLKEMGIPGIKYLDELSRRPGVASMTQSQIDARISSLKKDIGSGLGNQERMKQQLASLEQERASHRNLTRNFVTFPGEEKNLTILERNNTGLLD